MLQNFKDRVQAWRQRSDKGLFQQWREHLDLPPKEVKANLPRRKGNLYQQWVQEGSLAPENMPREPVVSSIVPKDANPSLVKRLIKYIIIEGAVIVVLLIALAVVATILVVKAG